MFVIIGATGNTGSAVAQKLLATGQKVRVVGRSEAKLQRFTSKGAEAFGGDVLDIPAMTRAFNGARGVYAIIPPNYSQDDFRGYQGRVSESLGKALQTAGVEYVVALSSIGTQLPEGAGPISGLHHFEQRLNQIPGLNVLHLRAGYFFENFFWQIGTIQRFGMLAGALRADLSIPMIATRDIGIRAAEALLRLDFRGHQTRELLGPADLTLADAAVVIGNAIGRPDLKYSQLPYEQVEQAMLQMGLARGAARSLNEMYAGFNEGRVQAQESRSPANTTPTTFETFVAEEFVPRFRGQVGGR